MQTVQFGKRSTADDVLENKGLTGKTMIVTGANTGIGFEAARSLAAKGANVIMACRNTEKGEIAASEIRQRHKDVQISIGALDLASFDSIKAFVSNLGVDQIDALICNAGVIHNDYRDTTEGFEVTVGVCHIGHFLFTSLLMPQLRAAVNNNGEARVVMVASESHRQPAKLSFDKFPLKKDNYAFMTAYGQAKLCNILFANELNRRYVSEGITACSLHPGTMITTGIARNTMLGTIAMKLLSPFTKNPNQGAATTVYCAAYADPNEIGGVYFSDCAPKKMTREAANPETAKRLWSMSEGWCGSFGGS
jgi:WW domain-containing oxidoreductase